MHEKVFAEIKGKCAIEILLDHLLDRYHFLDDYQIIMAIPDNKEDDRLKEVAEAKGIEVFRGHDRSPLHRMGAVAEKYGFDHVVRITHDDILIDSLLLKNQVKFHINGGQDYTYIAKCPEGVGAEVIKTSALKKAVETAGEKEVEYVSYYVKSKGFTVKEYYPPPEYQYSFRLTMDYDEDLLLLRILHICLHSSFGTLDAINFLNTHKYLLQVNHLPNVTLYTSVYNGSAYIIDCVESVINQDYNDYEYIILDDYSTDNTLELLIEWYSKLSLNCQKKVTILRNDNNLGLPANCNRMLSKAKGKFLMRIDGDDLLEPDAVSLMVEEMEVSNVEGIVSGYNKINFKGEVIGEMKDNHWHPACCLLDKKVVNEIKYKENIKYFEGAIFWDMYNKMYKIKFLPRVLWSYRQHDDQKSAEVNREERQKFKEEHNIESIHGSVTSG